jgi:chemotaxis methyl-accepting protein methylase
MKTNYIQTQNCQNNPNFNSWYRSVGKNKKTLMNLEQELSYRNDTYWFRGNITELIDDLVDIYADSNDVNMYIYGCSNGSEPCSMWMYLVSKYGKDVADKFRPFRAKDIDPYAINMAKNGIMPIDCSEFASIQRYTNYGFDRFFHFNKQQQPLSSYFYTPAKYRGKNNKFNGRIIQPKAELTQNIEYSVADIMKDYKNIGHEKSIICARNFWPYIPKAEIAGFLSNLGQQLEQGSVLIFGSFDFCPDLYNFDFGYFLKNTLLTNGFSKYQGNYDYIYIKN